MDLAPQPVVVAAIDPDRAIPFQLVFNVRDLGGLPTRDGGSVRRGQVFRADGVHRLAGADLEVARALGLRTVIDLRTERELERGRFPLDEYPVDWHHLPVMRRIWSDDELIPTTTAAAFLCDRYLDMLVDGGEAIATAVRLIATGGPTLFHCSAGKDRTGVVAAVVLGLLDVDEAVIAADYHASAAAMAGFVDWLTVEFPEALDSMTSQPPEYLEAPPEAMLSFLEQVRSRHGSMRGLAAELGITEATIAALTTSLKDPAR